MPGFGLKIACLVAVMLGVSAACAQDVQIPTLPLVPTQTPTPTPMPLPMPNTTELPAVPAPNPATPAQLASPSTDFLTAPPGLPPLPGTVADQYATELAAREQFRAPTWRGDSFDGLPNTLLWQPGLAVRRDPRLQFNYSNLGNYRGSNTVDTNIGGTQGLIRYNVGGADLSYQLDIFGVVITRLSPNDLVAADYRFGVPITWQRGWWSGKIAYEHTRAHLGDEFIKATGTDPRSWAKDEIVLGLSRVFYDQFRLFGTYGYAFSQQLPNYDNPGTNPTDLANTTANRSRLDIGFDWYNREPTGFLGTPFLAANAEARGDQNWTANLRAQAGWMWRNPYMRMGTARVFIEYYTGKSNYGLLYQNKETYTSVGFGFDY